MFALVLVIFICLLGMVMDSAANIIVVGPVLVEVMVKAVIRTCKRLWWSSSGF